MSPGKLVPGAPGSARLLNSRGYFVRVKCVTAHAQSIKSRGHAAHASAIKRGVMSSTLRTLRRNGSSQVLLSNGRSTSRREGGNDCADECVSSLNVRRSRRELNVSKIPLTPRNAIPLSYRLFTRRPIHLGFFFFFFLSKLGFQQIIKSKEYIYVDVCLM